MRYTNPYEALDKGLKQGGGLVEVRTSTQNNMNTTHIFVF
jgi:hypothetical protein